MERRAIVVLEGDQTGQELLEEALRVLSPDVIGLEFELPRYDDFPALNLARCARETGGTLPAVMNAANEIAVAAFLDRQVRFPRIWQIVEQVMDRHRGVAHPDLDEILQADRWARTEAAKTLKG